MIKINK